MGTDSLRGHLKQSQVLLLLLPVQVCVDGRNDNAMLVKYRGFISNQ